MFNLTKTSVLSLLLLSLISACSPKSSHQIEKIPMQGIMNGQKVHAGESIAASIVGIYNVRRQYICTGSLIAPNVILTAAHCTEGKAANIEIIFSLDIKEIISTHNPDIKAQYTRTATDYEVHPTWNPDDTKKYEDTGDIALIKFAGTLPAGYQPATFLTDSSELQVGAMVTLAGFGVNTVENVLVDPEIYGDVDSAIENDLIYCDKTKKKCMETTTSGEGPLRFTHAPIASIQKTELTLNEKKAGTCVGDSGGPAYIEKEGHYFLFGITSRGTKFCEDDGVYTNALSYEKWIRETLSLME